MISHWHIIILFNARWEDGCDYAQQTIRLTAKHNRVIAVPLAHERSIWQAITHWLNGSFFTQYHQAAVFTPITFLPFRSIGWLKNLNMWLNALLLKLMLKRTNDNAIQSRTSRRLVWFFEPMHVPVWVRVFADWNTLYDCVDYWLGFSGQVEKLHTWLVQRATWMVVNSKALLEATRQHRQQVIQVPLGFASEEFARPKKAILNHMTDIEKLTLHKLKRKPGQKIFGFIGQIGNRFDFPWLIQLMQAFPEHIFVFIGAIWAWKELDDSHLASQITELQAQPNYVHLPPVAKATIPVLVQQFDFGLIPYTSSQVFNKNCHPMKLYEYWWFGKPVIATSIYELSRYARDLYSGDDAHSAIQWVKQKLKNGYSPRSRQRIQQTARDNSWHAKLTAISEVVTAQTIEQPQSV